MVRTDKYQKGNERQRRRVAEWFPGPVVGWLE